MRFRDLSRRVAAVTALTALSVLASGAATAAPGGFQRGFAPHFGGGFYGRGFYGPRFYGRGFYGWGGYWGPWWGLGLFLPVLPLYYQTLWWNGTPYYYAGNTYYVWNGGVGEYEQVNPPPGLRPSGPDPGEAAMSGTELFVYPKSGQSEAQQARDREECRRWASDQTVSGTPSTPPAAAKGAPARDTIATRQDYLRTQTACLEGRNYSVR